MFGTRRASPSPRSRATDDGDHLIRVEAYGKRYESLAGRTRDAVTRGGGTGVAMGLDLFIKEELGLLGLTGRLAYSFID